MNITFNQFVEIESAMLTELRKCGSHPSPRYCRKAFIAAMKTLDIDVKYIDDQPTTPAQPDKK